MTQHVVASMQIVSPTMPTATSGVVAATAANDRHTLVELQTQLLAAEQRASAQQRKCDNLTRYYGAQLRRLTAELGAERAKTNAGRHAHQRTHNSSPELPASWQPPQSPIVVDALLLRFEAKLRAEQSAIRQQMHAKDAQLNRLHHELAALRGERPATADVAADATQFCPACRKHYHRLHTKSASVQTPMTNDNNSKDTSTTTTTGCGGSHSAAAAATRTDNGHGHGGGGAMLSTASASPTSPSGGSAGTSTTGNWIFCERCAAV